MSDNLPYGSQAALDVLAERARQLKIGWSPDHDDGHHPGDLADAGISYGIHAVKNLHRLAHSGRVHTAGDKPRRWPWGCENWKPKDPRRDLVRAAALIIAEIERMDRDQP